MLLSIALSLTQANAGWAQDADLLRTAFEQLHPGLYRYNTPAQMDRNFAELRSKLEQAKDRKAAYRAISELTGKVQCGHTYPNFFNQSDTIVGEVFSGRNRLPFHFRWIDRSMVVTRDLTERKSIPPGTEILSIDGSPVATILKTLMPISRADGGNDAKRTSNLELHGTSRYEAFDIYYPLYFRTSGTFKLKMKPPRGSVVDTFATALTRENRLRAMTQAAAPWTITEVKPGIHQLTMPTWAMFNSRWDWQGFLAKSFEDLKTQNSRALIIDIRGNEGGSAVGEVVLSYLLAKPTIVDAFAQYTRYRTLPASLKPYAGTWDRSFDNWSRWTPETTEQVAGNQLYRMRRWDNPANETIAPRQPVFGGDVAVLMDSSNSSATFQFIQLMRATRRGVLIGEPSGGNLRGINGSAFYFFKLPNTDMEVDIPLVAAIAMTAAPNAGITPDITVRPSAADIADGRDVVLERAIRELSKP